jgi:pimeloyl-ACP methyl ester carboxylesterase
VFFESAFSGQVAALAQDLLDFIDALRLRSILVVGHDWGARAAERFYRGGYSRIVVEGAGHLCSVKGLKL